MHTKNFLVNNNRKNNLRDDHSIRIPKILECNALKVWKDFRILSRNHRIRVGPEHVLERKSAAEISCIPVIAKSDWIAFESVCDSIQVRDWSHCCREFRKKEKKRFHVNTLKETILHEELNYVQTEVIASRLFSQIKLRTASAIRADLISVQTSCQGKIRNIGWCLMSGLGLDSKSVNCKKKTNV